MNNEFDKEYIDYQKIGRTIFSDKTPLNAVPDIIDTYHRMTKPDKSDRFLTTLFAYLGRFTLPTISLIKKDERSIIKASLKGQILFVAEQINDWEPMIIIGEEGYNAGKLIKQINQQVEGKDDTDRFNIIETICDRLKNEDGIEVFVPKMFPKSSDNAVFVPQIKNGDPVLKNDTIGYIEYYDFTSKAQKMLDKQHAAYSHIAKLMGIAFGQNKSFVNEQVKEGNYTTDKSLLNDDNKPKPSRLYKKQYTKSLKLNEIWNKSKLDLYCKITESLQEKRDIAGKKTAFLIKEGEDLVWNIQVDKKYLAGFLHVCIMRSYIKDIYSAPEIMEICKNTFSIDSLDKNLFSNITINERIKPEYYLIFDFLPNGLTERNI